MYTQARWLVTVWLVAGCAGGREEMRGSAGSEAELNVGLLVDVGDADGRQLRVLKPAEPLHAREQVALNIDVDRPASIYVAQELPDGKLDLLFSQTGEQQVMPGQPLRFPSEGHWLRPVGNTPEESVFVVASTRPFIQLEPDLCTTLKRFPCSLAHDDSSDGTRGGDPKQQPKEQKEQKDPPPSKMDTKTRDLRSKDYNLRARSDGNGVAVLRLVLRHER